MKKILLLLGLCFLLNSCVETVVVGAVTTGVIIAQEKSILQTKDDLLIHSKINKALNKKNLKDELKNVNVKVYEGRVFLLGKVGSKEYSDKAIKVIWTVEGVKEVVDETTLFVAKEDLKVARVRQISRDAIITSRVKTKFLAKKEIKSVNYDIETIDGVVYLIGIAQSNKEVERSAKIASKVRGVKKVVSHVLVKSDSRRI